MLKFDNVTNLLLPFKFIVSVRLSNSSLGSDVLLFLEFINTVSILFYKYVKFIILLYNSLIISFAWYNEHMIWRISCSKFSDILPAFPYARSIDNLWSICLGVNILSCLQPETLAIQVKILGRPFPCICFPFGNSPPSKALTNFCLSLRSKTPFILFNS